MILTGSWSEDLNGRDLRSDVLYRAIKEHFKPHLRQDFQMIDIMDHYMAHSLSSPYAWQCLHNIATGRLDYSIPRDSGIYYADYGWERVSEIHNRFIIINDLELESIANI